MTYSRYDTLLVGHRGLYSCLKLCRKTRKRENSGTKEKQRVGEALQFERNLPKIESGDIVCGKENKQSILCRSRNISLLQLSSMRKENKQRNESGGQY